MLSVGLCVIRNLMFLWHSSTGAGRFMVATGLSRTSTPYIIRHLSARKIEQGLHVSILEEFKVLFQLSLAGMDTWTHGHVSDLNAAFHLAAPVPGSVTAGMTLGEVKGCR